MTDLYRQCGVPVDPDFVRHLKQQLDVRRSANAAARSATQTAGPSAVRHTEVPIVLKPVKQPDHRGRWIALAAAIVAGVVGLGAVLVLVDRDDTELRPSDTRPTDTTAPTSVPSQPTVAPTVPASTLPAFPVDTSTVGDGAGDPADPAHPPTERLAASAADAGSPVVDGVR